MMNWTSWKECSLALPARIFLEAAPEVRRVDVCEVQKFIF